MVAAFAERRQLIVAALNSLPGFRCARPGGAFYTFPNIAGTGSTPRALQSRMLEEAGVATIAGTSFGAFGEGYLRFSYANSREAIAEAIERIRSFLGNLPDRALPSLMLLIRKSGRRCLSTGIGRRPARNICNSSHRRAAWHGLCSVV